MVAGLTPMARLGNWARARSLWISPFGECACTGERMAAPGDLERWWARVFFTPDWWAGITENSAGAKRDLRTVVRADRAYRRLCAWLSAADRIPHRYYCWSPTQ